MQLSLRWRGSGRESGWPWKPRVTPAGAGCSLLQKVRSESQIFGGLHRTQSSALASLPWPKCVFEFMGFGEELWLRKCPGWPLSVKESSF